MLIMRANSILDLLAYLQLGCARNVIYIGDSGSISYLRPNSVSKSDVVDRVLHKKMDVTRESINLIFEASRMLLTISR